MSNPTQYQQPQRPGAGQAPRVAPRRPGTGYNTQPVRPGGGGRKGNSTLLVVILTVLIIAIIGLGVYLLMGGKSDKTSAGSGNDTESVMAATDGSGDKAEAASESRSKDGRISTSDDADVFSVGGVRFNMRHVPGGTFTMGATNAQDYDARPEEYPAHEVTLSSFTIGETEVTQGLWKAVMGSNPSSGYQSDDRPVTNVSYNQIKTFISRLNDMTGESFRLPTEAEWEYAARGGRDADSDYIYSGSDIATEVGWVKSNSGGELHPVAQLRPNQLGIYDMTGNVFEFVSDPYGSYSYQSQTNPRGSGSGRVGRGGGYSHDAKVARVSRRTRGNNTQADASLGFRLAR